MTQTASSKHYPMKKTTAAARRDEPPAPQWPQPRYLSVRGTSSNGRVAVLRGTPHSATAQQNAQDLVGDADRVVARTTRSFGTTGGPVSVIIFALDGATRRDRRCGPHGLDYQTGAEIEVCASFGNSAGCPRCSSRVERVLHGRNLCGVSTGEALSRWWRGSYRNNPFPIC